ncbi:uncharacterized protein LOC110883150 [Helianthus annuus]|uniref:uncharacterized protein LOC110883150 n=1 Tax=Helianthus annuus TaxID=4232 RepID=UPI000B8EF4A9|nr:uncharacterized protein LOC110883150 [Helianthus annuus]
MDIFLNDASARTTWLKLEKIFLSNKKAKAAALETRFVNLTLAACSSVDDYCKQLKDIANQLDDVGEPMTESRLDADWDLARSMLNDEVIRQAARQQQSSSILVASTVPNSTTQSQQPSAATSSPDNTTATNSGSYQSNYRGRGRGKHGQNYRGRGGRGRGYQGNPTGTSWQFQNS